MRLIVTAFRKVVMPYPVGTEVQLPDGRTGVVAHVDMTRPDEPVVRSPARTCGSTCASPPRRPAPGRRQRRLEGRRSDVAHNVERVGARA